MLTAVAKENHTARQWKELTHQHALVAFEDLDSDVEKTENTNGVLDEYEMS